MAFLQLLLKIAIPAFAVSSMFFVGARFTLREILRPFRNLRGLILVLAANFVLVPLLGVGVAHLVAPDRSLEIGLILVATAAGAPFVLRLTAAAAGNVAFSSGLLVILLVLTIPAMPFLVPLAVPGTVLQPLAIAAPLLLTMLLPFGAGIGTRMGSKRLTRRLLPIANSISFITLIMIVVLAFGLNYRELPAVGGAGILAAAILIGGAYGIGVALGAVGGESRAEVGLSTAQRGIAAASVVAIEAFHDHDALVMIIVASLVGLAILFPLAGVTRRRRNRGIPGPRLRRAA